jgi:quercetin dioxygenase-like cupin family protein
MCPCCQTRKNYVLDFKKEIVMKPTMFLLSLPLTVGIAMGMIGTQVLNAQQAPSVKTTILLKQDMSLPGWEAVMSLQEFPPGAVEDRHTHPAEAYGFVLEGTISLEIEGMPTATLKAGDVFHIAPGEIHQVINNGNVPAKSAVVLVAEKGKPLRMQVQ